MARYYLDFGSANAGLTPTFTLYDNADTGGSLTQPTISELGSGLYYFDQDWTSLSATSIVYKATVAGVELSDVINSEAVVASSAVATATTAAVMPWLWTAGRVVNAAAVQCGLTEWADPYSSTDANAVRLRSLLIDVGQDLVTQYPWRTLIKAATLTTSQGDAGDYSLPSDFISMVDQSGWKQGTYWPVDGPVTDQVWQYLINRVSSTTVTAIIREAQGLLQVFPRPVTSAYTISFQYRSRAWVKADGATTAALNEPTQSNDIVMFEPAIAVKALRFKFLSSTGLDATQAYREYQEALDAVKSLRGSQRLRMDGPTALNNRLIDAANLPLTGFGS